MLGKTFVLFSYILLLACAPKSRLQAKKVFLGSNLNAKQDWFKVLDLGEADNINMTDARREVMLYAFGLLNVNYKFGGANPEAGLDCSGMLSYIYKEALGINLPHHAASIAQIAKPIAKEDLQAGDLVFFNTMNRSFSHMGIYIGNNKFIHAPRTNSVVRVDDLHNSYFAARFEGGRTLF